MEIQSAESAFRAVWVAPSIILSLGITRLCSDMILWVRSYRHFSLDWIPLTWSACIFIWQIQYLWAIIELPSLIRTWTLPEFLALLLLSLTIFLRVHWLYLSRKRIFKGFMKSAPFGEGVVP
ncbi:hypothetical protein [Acinetobacter tandoii]|uniref:hypothetical protein n=1 Tax=Acinetobacter tandoii TaxID=202954 RepID=UPI0013052F52|nr:hypothetical protein [Acinetobacter tandoii]